MSLKCRCIMVKMLQRKTARVDREGDLECFSVNIPLQDAETPIDKSKVQTGLNQFHSITEKKPKYLEKLYEIYMQDVHIDSV